MAGLSDWKVLMMATRIVRASYYITSKGLWGLPQRPFYVSKSSYHIRPNNKPP